MEILSEIFELACLPEDGVFHSSLTMVFYTHSLSSVCAAWRKVALATPQLWSKLCINDGIKVLADVEWVKKWANRSRSLPLDVYVSLCRDASLQLLEQILECRHRIRTLDVAGDPRPYTALFNLPRSSFSQLEQVTLSFRHLDGFLFPSQIEAFLDAPNLYHVQIKGPACSSAFLKALVFPVEQLTTLSFDSRSVISDTAGAVCMDNIHACINLVNLEIALPLRRGLTSNMYIFLPLLKSLKIVCHDLYDFLCCLTLPLLEHLTLCGYCGDIGHALTTLADFQRRSAISLSSLTLEDFYGNDVGTWMKNLTVTMGMLPEVQSLHLHRMRFDINLLLRALTCSEGSQVLLPKLTHLGLQPYRPPVAYPSELTSMVLSRWWPYDSETTASPGLIRLQKVTLRGFHYDEQISGLSGLEINNM
ncbi:hypothetical protein BT96DRAFT_150514 [Gymnopus androsaceus JB14]|uniref:Uncharacterized protein n=1 Tax=Gymnopus androsaceus JB14 TaxID=1447944 RepID=A0A6A4IB33_9AGAR|nr:hypothetical protein BT96DRAFT_150514 [Gymnopus androsaceus JB14]